MRLLNFKVVEMMSINTPILQNGMPESQDGRYISNYSIGTTLSATLNSAPVLLRTSSTVTPSANSMSVRPDEKSTSNTHNSVIILETHDLPVSGNTQAAIFN